MAFPVNHKTVFVLDHSHVFGQSCAPVDLDQGGSSIGFLQPEKWPKNYRGVRFEKDACIYFQFWTF